MADNSAVELTIGSLAKRADCRVETIRFYERAGLMPAPPRSPGGHRLYGRQHMKRMTFIRRARKLGFTLNEVRRLLGLADSGDFTCTEVKAETLRHRADVRRKIAELKRLDAALDAIATRCNGGTGKDCAIFDALFETGP
ncbi:MAG: helix-turn-helix domain-containing protein [Pseudomonadota bacterium]